MTAPDAINLNGINGIAEISVRINHLYLHEILPMNDNIVQKIYELIHVLKKI